MLKKSWITASSFAIALGIAIPAWGATTLKQVQALEGGRVELLFDGKVKGDQIQADFFGETIQLTFKDAAVYPAKISNLNGHSVTKVFAYQYAPRVVRCRLSVRGNAEDYRSRLQILPSGKSVAVVFSEKGVTQEKDSISSSQAARIVESGKDETPDSEERALRERVSRDSSNSVPSKSATRGAKSEPLATGKPIGSPVSVMAKLVGVLAIFLVAAVLARRFLAGRGSGLTKGALSGAKGISKLSAKIPGLKGLSGIRAGSPIEVIATHYLGPKKSIAVVKIAGRQLVIGITDDSINLITQLGSAGDALTEGGSDADADLILDQLTGGGTSPRAASVLSEKGTIKNAGFDQALDRAESVPQATQSNRNGVRSQIRARLEGMKQL